MNKIVIFDKDLLNNIDNIKFTDDNKIILKTFNDIDNDFIQSLTTDLKLFIIAKNEIDFISLEFLNFVKQKWWSVGGSNSSPLPCHGSALPNELTPRVFILSQI